MKLLNIFMWIRRAVLAAAGLAALFLAVAFLPGSIEGAYPGQGLVCGCDSLNFSCYRDGRMLLYAGNHPPAELVGRYEVAPGGGINVYLLPWKEGTGEKMVFSAYPHLLLTRFVDVRNGNFNWYWKWPRFGKIGEIIATQEIVGRVITADGGFIRTTFYDKAFHPTKTETKASSKAKKVGESPT